MHLVSLCIVSHR